MFTPCGVSSLSFRLAEQGLELLFGFCIRAAAYHRDALFLKQLYVVFIDDIAERELYPLLLR